MEPVSKKTIRDTLNPEWVRRGLGNGRPGGLTHDKRNQGFAAANLEYSPVEMIGQFRQLANLSPDDPPPPNGNPGALAGATGAKSIELASFRSEEYRTRHENARRLGDAIAECHPEDACILMEAALADLLAERMPPAPFLGIMPSARFWADWASVSELKAYCLASFERLSAADQSAFLAHVGGRLQ